MIVGQNRRWGSFGSCQFPQAQEEGGLLMFSCRRRCRYATSFAVPLYLYTSYGQCDPPLQWQRVPPMSPAHVEEEEAAAVHCSRLQFPAWNAPEEYRLEMRLDLWGPYLLRI